MRIAPFCLAFGFALHGAPALAADAGIISIAEGSPSVLRGTTWFKLVAGARYQEGDILVVKGTGQVQVELFAGGTFNLGAPGTLFAAAVPITAGKLTGPVELALPEGWLKLAANAPGSGIRVQIDTSTLNAAEAITVIHAQPGALELFVESGTASLVEAGTGGGKPAAPQEMKAGEYAARSAERPLRFERRAPAAFVATIPRQLIDPLPSLAGKFKAASPQLTPEREVTYAEAEPWLAGPVAQAIPQAIPATSEGPRVSRGCRGAHRALSGVGPAVASGEVQCQASGSYQPGSYQPGSYQPGSYQPRRYQVTEVAGVLATFRSPA